LVWAAARFVWWRALAVADFRREYGLSTDDIERLPAVEFAQLMIGLSRRSEIARRIAGDPETAALAAAFGGQPQPSQQKYQKQATVPKGQDYLNAARRLHGRVKIVKQGEASA
jgi:hypothetical protein